MLWELKGNMRIMSCCIKNINKVTMIINPNKNSRLENYNDYDEKFIGKTQREIELARESMNFKIGQLRLSPWMPGTEVLPISRLIYL